MATQYRVMKKIDDEWYYEGTWKDPIHLANFMYELGQMMKDPIKIIPEEVEDDSH